jgi:hypothetical protein
VVGVRCVYGLACFCLVHDDTCRHRASSLLCNFHLFRLGVAYEVREDIEVSAWRGAAALDFCVPAYYGVADIMILADTGPAACCVIYTCSGRGMSCKTPDSCLVFSSAHVCRWMILCLP